MELSRRVQRIQPSATLTINAKAGEMKSRGLDVISLAAGEPDFLPPDRVTDRAGKAVEGGHTRYTPVPGSPELRRAAANYFARFYGVQAEPENILVSNGGKQCLYNLCQALLDPGDEVLIPAPYWVSYPEMVRLADGEPVVLPTDPENDFLLQPEAIKEAVGPRTKALILNTPSNPTGCHYSQEQLDRVLEQALARDLYIISDEIYDQLVYPPARPASAAPWLASSPWRVAVVNGLSKSFALTGWRIGYVLAHEEIIQAMSKIQGQSTSNICTIAQEAAIAALEGSFDFLEHKRGMLSRRRDLALERISSWSGAVCPRPDGAFYLFPRLDAYYGGSVTDSTSMCTYLLEEAGVALVPGAAFGDDRCIRLSYALADEELDKALTRMGEALAKL
ncbi:MAG: pyridoxal phosphate-dependent aminotransferase [Desulfohalobiaceae bacterium]|nr:pyridoxal phosphate-dependent aminotransferase [Desulfohalobiaceae bacterium]